MAIFVAHATASFTLHLRTNDILPLCRPQNTPHNLPHKPFILIRLIKVPQRRIEAPPALKLLTPRQRMILAHLATLETIRITPQQDLQIHILLWMRVEIIPLVFPAFSPAATARNEVLLIRLLDQNSAGLGIRMLVEMCAAQFAVPFVVRHASGGAVDGDDATARANEVLQGGELPGVEDGADALEEHDGGVFAEGCGGEEGGVFTGGDGEMLGAGGEELDGIDSGGNGVVAVAGCFAKDKDAEGSCVRHFFRLRFTTQGILSRLCWRCLGARFLAYVREIGDVSLIDSWK
jgi:hypothetical protein